MIHLPIDLSPRCWASQNVEGCGYSKKFIVTHNRGYAFFLRICTMPMCTGVLSQKR